MRFYSKAKVVSIHDKREIFAEDDTLEYTVESKLLSIHGKTYVRNAQGEEVAMIQEKLISMHETHFVEMSDGEQFGLRSEWFHVMKDVIQIEELGWNLHGDILARDYEVRDNADRLIAKIHNKLLSIHQMAYIDVEDDRNNDKVIALYIALEHILTDRVERAGRNSVKN